MNQEKMTTEKKDLILTLNKSLRYVEGLEIVSARALSEPIDRVPLTAGQWHVKTLIELSLAKVSIIQAIMQVEINGMEKSEV